MKWVSSKICSMCFQYECEDICHSCGNDKIVKGKYQVTNDFKKCWGESLVKTAIHVFVNNEYKRTFQLGWR